VGRPPHPVDDLSLGTPKQKCEVFYLVGLLGLLAVDGVGEAQDAVFAAGDAIAEGEGLAGGGAAVGFFA
jgi:hypothetical protein